MAKKICKLHYASSYNKYFVTTKFVPDSDFHYHTFYEIEIILSGRIISFINGEKLVLEHGDAMCLLPSDVHNIIVEKKAEIFNMSFCANEENMECIDRIFYHNNEKKFHICEKDLDIICDVLRKIIDEQPIQTKIENKFTDKLFGAALYLVIRNVGYTSASTGEVQLAKSIRYIQEHFTEDISLENVAENVNLSSQYFSNFFHKKTGVTYKQYLENIRVAYAQSLMNATDISCTEACYEAGFGSYSAFLRAFKRVTGKSPNKS